MKYRVRVELTESGFADRTATATYGTFTAAETGIEPISSESESDVIPLHYSAIYKGDGELALNRQSSGLLVANSARAMLEPDRTK